MSALIDIALGLGFGVLVVIVAIRPRAGGLLAVLLFTLIGCCEAGRGHTPGVWIAVTYGIAFGVVPILAHYAYSWVVRPHKKP